MTTTASSHAVTGPTLKIWSTASDSLSDIEMHQMRIDHGHDALNRAIDLYGEQPTTATVRAHALAAGELVEAAQQYRRDLLKLYALCGGYDQPEPQEPPC